MSLRKNIFVYYNFEPKIQSWLDTTFILNKSYYHLFTRQDEMNVNTTTS